MMFVPCSNCGPPTCTNGTTLCWQLSACGVTDFANASLSAEVSGPDGNPVTPSISTSGGGASVCVPIGLLGVYSLSVKSSKTFAHTETAMVSACSNQSVQVKLQPTKFSVILSGCGYTDSGGTIRTGVLGASVSISNGYSSGSGTTDVDGKVTLDLSGGEAPNGIDWTLSATAERYAPLSVQVGGTNCSYGGTMKTADCWSCLGDTYDLDGKGCPKPVHTTGTVVTPFGSACVNLTTGEGQTLTANVLGHPYQTANGINTSCTTPLQQVALNVLVNILSGKLSLNFAKCISSQDGNCYPIGAPATGTGGISIPFTQKLQCDPLVLRGTFNTTNPCLSWANGTYTFTANGCGCGGQPTNPTDPTPTNPSQTGTPTDSMAQKTDAMIRPILLKANPSARLVSLNDRIRMLADICPFGSGPCGCGTDPRICSKPGGPSEVWRSDCLACKFEEVKDLPS